MHEYIERVVDLTDPNETKLLNISPDEARQRMLAGAPESVRGQIPGRRRACAAAPHRAKC